MAFSVETYSSEEQLGAVLQADVSTHTSEEALASALASAVAPFGVVAKGGFLTLIDSPLIPSLSLKVVGKGGFFTVILETA